MCSTCEAGFYCADDATSRVMMLNEMICPAGMHCPAGSTNAPDLVDNACKKGHYCLRGDEVCLCQPVDNMTLRTEPFC